MEEIGNSAANADEFMQRMVDRFIGPNLNVQSGNDFERAANIGNREFSDSGFKSQFQDPSDQVRHFTGGVWAGYRYGPGIGQLGMNSNEDNTLVPGRGVVNSAGGILPSFWPTEDSKADVALNAVSIPLGANLTPRAAEIVDRGDRRGGEKFLPILVIKVWRWRFALKYASDQQAPGITRNPNTLSTRDFGCVSAFVQERGYFLN